MFCTCTKLTRACDYRGDKQQEQQQQQEQGEEEEEKEKDEEDEKEDGRMGSRALTSGSKTSPLESRIYSRQKKKKT